MSFLTVFIIGCLILYIGAILYLIITAIRHPNEFKASVNELLDELLIR